MPVTSSRQCRLASLEVLSSASLVPCALIDAAPAQPRHSLPDIAALASNLEQIGLLQPLALRRLGGRYEVLSGHRRLAAYRLLAERHPADPQWTAILSVVSRTDDETAFLSMVSAQVHAIGWTATEEAEALECLLKGGMTQRDAARLLNRTEGWLSKRIRAYRDGALSEQVKSGQLAPGTAEELLPVRAPAQRREMATRAAAEGWSQSEARARVRHLTTDPLVRDVGRRARSLAKDVRGLDPSAITGGVLADLVRLAEVIEQRVPRNMEAKTAA